jgi:hypothetical protein
MPRIRKKSTQPKRKPKKPIKIEKPVYPEYIETFIQEVESKTPFTVKVDQYTKDKAYHIGVNQKIGRVFRCVWMVGFVMGPEHLQSFWTSLPMQDVTDKRV